MRRAARMAVGLALVGGCLLAARGVAADGPDASVGQEPLVLPFDVPWAERAARLERIDGRSWVTVAVVGQPDARAQRLGVKRSTARDRATTRARRELHRWVDDALAAILAPPRTAAAAHAVVRREARILGVRPLADGTAVVVAGLPAAPLRRAAPAKEVPWVP